MNEFRKILIIFSMLSSIFGKDLFQNWINNNEFFFISNTKSIKFSYQIKNDKDIYGGEVIDDGIVIFNDESLFKLIFGTKTIVSNGNYWTSYDSRNNQIIMQNPDYELMDPIFFLSKKNNLKNLKYELKNNTMMTKFLNQKYIINFSDTTINSIETNSNDISIVFFDFSFGRVDSVQPAFFTLTKKDAIVIDLRND